MAQIICFNVYPTKWNLNKMRTILVDDHGFEEKNNQNGPYFYIEVSSLDSWQIKTLLNVKGYKYRSYDKRYERSGSYRKKFFEHYKGPYRCAYCGKRLKDEYIEIDHLIPVAKAKREMGVRTWLHLCGITNVNDVKNLVASCSKCNRKKSDKMGLWVFKGMLGRHKQFWIIRDIIILIIILLIIGILFAFGGGIFTALSAWIKTTFMHIF